MKVMSRNNDPLVSIIVITYNSSKYVLETLESAKAQTYQNIELIVSDDASQDDTVEICKAWLEENGERYVRTDFVTVDKNTGTSANCNRGLNAAKGEWVKFIAGDDLLENNFLNNMSHIFCESSRNIIAGSIYKFKQNIEKATFSWPKFEFPVEQKTQKMEQLINGLLLAPSVVLRKSKIIELGGFDVRFPIMEDDPMWIKIFEDGNICSLSKESIVYYRQHFDSINSQKSRSMYYRKPVFLKDSINFGLQVKLPMLRKYKLYKHYILFYLIKIFELLIYKRGSRSDNKINAFIAKLIGQLNKFYSKAKY